MKFLSIPAVFGAQAALLTIAHGAPTTAESGYVEVFFDPSKLHSSASNSSLEARAISGHFCNEARWNGGRGLGAGRDPINDGIKYLRGLSGNFNQPAKSCTRISCSYDAGIHLCNDNAYGITGGWGIPAYMAEDVVNLCTTMTGPAASVNGQEFDDQNFNVFVSGADSC